MGPACRPSPATSFQDARAAFEAAWLGLYLPLQAPRPIFRHGAIKRPGRRKNIVASIGGNACPPDWRARRIRHILLCGVIAALGCWVLPVDAKAEPTVFIVSYHNVDYAKNVCDYVLSLQKSGNGLLDETTAGAAQCKSVSDTRILVRIRLQFVPDEQKKRRGSDDFQQGRLPSSAPRHRCRRAGRLG
jgi:hypothetical protein